MSDLEKKIIDSKPEIEESNVNSPKAIYSKVNEKKAPVKYNFKLVFACLLVLLIGVGFFAVSFIPKNNVEKPIDNTTEEKPTENVTTPKVSEEGQKLELTISENAQANGEVTTFSSESELESFLSKQTKTYNTLSTSVKSDLYYESAVSNSSPKASEGESTGSISLTPTYSTNTRTDGVDEEDVVKVLGNHIYAIQNDYKITNKDLYYYEQYTELNIFEVDGAQTNLIKKYTFADEIEIIDGDDTYYVQKLIKRNPAKLFITEKYVALRVGVTERTTVHERATDKQLSVYSTKYFTEFILLDNETCEIVKTIRSRGNNNLTRLVGNDLYIINSYYEFYENNKFEYPCLWINGCIHISDYRSMCVINNDDSIRICTSIYKLTLDDEIAIENLNVFASYSNQVYMTATHLYLLNNTKSKVETDTNYKKTYGLTDVVIVGLTGDMKVLGNVIVRGYIKNQYFVDENEKYLRVLSTQSTNETFYFKEKYVVKTTFTTNNILTTYEKTIDGYKEISALENLCENKSISTARFNGDMLNIATSYIGEPIYYVDLTDPYNPVVTSTVDATNGYGKTLIPIKENYMLSLGFGGWIYNKNNYRTIEIILYDVSDKNNMKAVGNPYIIYPDKLEYSNYYAYIYATAISDPHALLVDKTRGIFGFEMNYSESQKQYNSAGYYTHYISKYYSNYFTFKIDLDEDCPIVLLDKAEMITYRNPETEHYPKYHGFTRMVFVGDNFYLLSNNEIAIYKYSDGELNYKSKYEIK